MAPHLLTVFDIAKRLQVSIKTVCRWIAYGELIAHKLGSQWRISETDYEVFVRTRRGAQPYR